jgi:hypothetical protein
MPQYKNYSEEELRKIVEKKLQKKDLELQFSGLKEEEAKKATSLYEKYVSETFFESLAEKSSLINLVYLELLKERLQKEISESGTVPMGMTEKLIDLDEQIIKTKDKLGMLKEGEELNFEQKWNDLEQKCLKYYEEHAAEFYTKCPYCSKLFPQILPPEKLEPKNAVWFKNTTLYNQEVFELYHQKRITLEEAAKILGVGKNYIELQYNEVYLKEKNDK